MIKALIITKTVVLILLLGIFYRNAIRNNLSDAEKGIALLVLNVYAIAHTIASLIEMQVGDTQ